MACSEGNCQCVTTREKVYCKFWIPSRGSVYYNCEWFLTQRKPCPYSNNARKPCRTCQYHNRGSAGAVGRPPLTDWDLRNEDERKEYYRLKAKERRALTSAKSRLTLENERLKKRIAFLEKRLHENT